MLVDMMGNMVRNMDCVAEMTESFVLYGIDSKDNQYGIIYGGKWVLPLGSTRKQQFEASEYVRLREDEISEETKTKLLALYCYYRKYKTLPPADLDIVPMMQEEIAELGNKKSKPAYSASPFEVYTSGSDLFEEDSEDNAEDDEDDLL